MTNQDKLWEDLTSLSDKVRKELEDNEIYAEVEFTLEPPGIMVEIYRGDWKRDHAATKYLIDKKFGLTCSRSETTEEDGTDCYSARHYFFLAPNYEQLPEMCYGVLDTTNEIVVIKKGEKGYYKTDYPAAKSREAANEWCDEINEHMGITRNVREAMETGSMWGWNVPGANPQDEINLKYLKK